MIRLPDQSLPENIAASLAKWQAEVDACGQFAERVTEARKRFKRRSRQAAFRPIPKALKSLTNGVGH